MIVVTGNMAAFFVNTANAFTAVSKEGLEYKPIQEMEAQVSEDGHRNGEYFGL
jgi:hypothetical protein